MSKLSIVISTYNRHQLYQRVVASLTPQLVNGVEIVTVEGVVGLARSRNQGWKKAKGEYVAFIDDDAIASASWVKEILGFIKKHRSVVAFGGPYNSSNQRDIPSWIPRELTGKVLPGKTARPINLGAEWLNGTNMIFSRQVLQALGGFDESLGIKGSKRGYGEETDLQIRLHNAGYEIWYSPKIMVEHEFASFKQNLWYLIKNQYLHGLGSIHTFKHLRKSNPGKTATSLIAKLLKPKLLWQTRLYYFLSPLAYLLGQTLAKLKSSLA